MSKLSKFIDEQRKKFIVDQIMFECYLHRRYKGKPPPERIRISLNDLKNGNYTEKGDK